MKNEDDIYVLQIAMKQAQSDIIKLKTEVEHLKNRIGVEFNKTRWAVRGYTPKPDWSKNPKPPKAE